MSRLRVLLFAAAGAACAPAFACKTTPVPTTAGLVADADAIHVVDVIRIEADPDRVGTDAEPMPAIAVVDVVETLKGAAVAAPLRVATQPDFCGSLLWPGRWLVLLSAPDATTSLWRTGTGSFPLAIDDDGAELEEIKSLLSGNHE